MKQWIRLSALLLVILMCASTFFACGTPTDDPNTEGETPETPETPEDEGPQLLDPANANILVSKDGQTQYVIIRDNDASSTVKNLTTGFRNQFWATTGSDIQVMDDTTRPIAKEIIVSTMDGREEPARELAKLNAPEGKGYRISLDGEKIVVAAEEEYLSEALDLLATAISECTDGSWGLPKDYLGLLDLPRIPLKGELYNVGEGNYAYNINSATDAVFNDLNADMIRDGFTLYAENVIGDSKFKTYIKDSIYGNMVAYLMYHPKIKTLRLTYGPMEYLPNATPIAEADQSDPTLTQMYMEMVNNGYVFGSNHIINGNDGAPGMSYLLQLSDGRFIVIDGGNSDGQVNTAKYDPVTGNWIASDEKISTSDAKRLYDTMCQMKPASHGKPQIAVWFMSHPHGDHMNLARSFFTTYKSSIELDLVAFNFPHPANNVGHQPSVDDFRKKAEEYFGAETWIMHTGQQLFLPGCEIEVMSTVEDFYCGGYVGANESDVDLNNTCVVYRITMGKTSFMVLGDAYPATGQFMADAYGDALESDIMQLAHHGFNGGVYSLYTAVDPKICFWPCDQFRYETDSRNIGTSTGDYSFNWYLRNKKWTRDGLSGDRTHYTASYMTTINANTGKVTK